MHAEMPGSLPVSTASWKRGVSLASMLVGGRGRG